MANGAMLSEEPVPAWHCNTASTGWLNGSHPNGIGETINSTICFNRPSASDNCNHRTQIQIKNCKSYFLYYLVDTVNCRFRYCTSNSKSEYK